MILLYILILCMTVHDNRWLKNGKNPVQNEQHVLNHNLH